MGYLIINNTLPYKVYSAEILQTSNNAPQEINIFENTLGTFTYNYLGTGQYEIISNNLFLNNKTFILFNLAFLGILECPIVWCNRISDSIIQIDCKSYFFSATRFLATDDIINGYIEIRVYN